MTEVTHTKEGKRGSFNYHLEGNRLAEMVYSMEDENVMIIEHTEVDESLRGQGIGRKLQESLVDYVRMNNIKVVPICPFAKTTFQRMKEWQDVLKGG